MKLTKYEIEVLRIMLKGVFSLKKIDKLSKSKIEWLEFTGSGYLLHVKNDIIPIRRKVISEPIVTGNSENIFVGFVIFLEEGGMTLECHSWGDVKPSDTIREKAMVVKVVKQ